MKKLESPIDQNIYIRLFHLHYFIHIYRSLMSQSLTDIFTVPRFQLFRDIKHIFSQKSSNSLFKNLLITYKFQIIIGAIVSIIGACFNLVVPVLIRSFIQFINKQNLSKKQLSNSSSFLYQFIFIQIMRLFFAEHSKRLFHQLAIRVQSSLAYKLINKSLNISKQYRDKIPQSQIIMLQNVDSKLVFTLFKNMYLFFQVPFTILVALIMLFLQNKRYGIIAIYWFFISFLLQRQLDGKMTHCNQTKLHLIQKRSSINYQLLFKMKQAKTSGHQNLIIEKNNDFFIEENHDHQLFYKYATLYDIILLLMPILVVSTITFYDMNQDPPITVQQVYAILALLGTCYLPMKSTRIISISLHDGLLRLKHLQQFFDLPQENPHQYNHNSINQKQQIYVIIKQNTIGCYPKNHKFKLQNTYHIQLHPGQRLNIFSRKSNGGSSYLQMLIGSMKKISGQVLINGKIAYKPQKPFFIKQSIQENIRFFNKNIDTEKVRDIYQLLNLHKEIQAPDGLHTIMDDMHKFTSSVLQKISLARILISNADIYILDALFSKIDQDTALKVQGNLRFKQQVQKKIIISTLVFSDYIYDEDYYLIIQKGKTIQYGTLKQLKNICNKDLSNNKNSQIPTSINKYFKNKENQKAITQILSLSSKKQSNQVQQISNNIIYPTLTFKKTFTEHDSYKSGQTFHLKRKLNSSLSLNKYIVHSLVKKIKQDHQQQKKFTKYVKKFFKAIKFTEAIYILIVILSAQFLHIFIHVFIGHLSEDQMNDGYQNYKNLLFLQIILTICLAGIIYLEGQISSYISIIIGNKLYQQALTQLTHKRITWFSNQYSVKIADRFNHVMLNYKKYFQDYEQIFIAVHGILGIYKNVIIFIATIQFIDTNRSNIILIMLIIGLIYYFIYHVIRDVQKKIIVHYYDFKYSFVRILQQSVKGAGIFKVFNVKNEIIQKAKQKYTRLASYKLAQSYTTYAISILTDIISTVLLGSAIYYGINVKQNNVHQRHISVVATSLTLLINLEGVLKIIIKQALNFGTFFAINLLPFLQIIDFDQEFKKNNNACPKKKIETPSKLRKYQGFNIQFDKVMFKDASTVPMSFTINEGQKVLIYQKDDESRNNLLYSITKNYPLLTEIQFQQNQNKYGKLLIGGQNIRNLQINDIRDLIGVIEEKNFYFSGSLKQNICEQILFNEKQALNYAHLIGLDNDFQNFKRQKFDIQVNFQSDQLSPFITKKMALMRIFLQKPKIIIIKDTIQFIGMLSMINLIESVYKQFKPTIIKIQSQLQQSNNMNRIIQLNQSKLIKDIQTSQLMQDQGQLAEQFKNLNMSGYLYQKQTSLTPFNSIKSIREVFQKNDDSNLRNELNTLKNIQERISASINSSSNKIEENQDQNHQN